MVSKLLHTLEICSSSLKLLQSLRPPLLKEVIHAPEKGAVKGRKRDHRPNAGEAQKGRRLFPVGACPRDWNISQDARLL